MRKANLQVSRRTMACSKREAHKLSVQLPPLLQGQHRAYRPQCTKNHPSPQQGATMHWGDQTSSANQRIPTEMCSFMIDFFNRCVVVFFLEINLKISLTDSLLTEKLKRATNSLDSLCILICEFSSTHLNV